MPVIGLDDFDKKGTFVSSGIFYILFGDPKLFSNFVAGALCLALFEGAYITEIVRAGIQSIQKGQWEAARAVGLSRLNVLRDIIFPQAIRKILPPLARPVHNPDQRLSNCFSDLHSRTHLPCNRG